MRESAKTIDQIAAEWVARADRGNLAPAEQAELDHWLAGDIRREGAYIRAQAVWHRLDNARALACHQEPATYNRFLPDLSRRQFLAAGSGAGLATLAAGGGAFWILSPSFQRFQSGLGEIRRIPLSDGSSASINTASKIAVSLNDKRRLIKLEQGEVWFDVAKDKTRPFIVDSGKVKVRAVGTAFAVRRHANGSQIIVSEGVVEARGGGGQILRLSAASGAFIADDAGTAKTESYSPAIVKRLLAWRQGMIALDGQTLAEAAADFNRFNARHIIVSDKVLAQERVVGLFSATDPESFASAAAATLGANLFKSDQEIHLTRSRQPK